MGLLRQSQPLGKERERGLSLVEVLVGLLIAMIGMVVIFQVLAVSEQRKRNTTFGSDAQTAGSIALYSLQRDVENAGYGFSTADQTQMGCAVQAYDTNRSGSKAFQFQLAPVVITQGNAYAGAPDTVAVLRGGSAMIVAPRAWTAQTGTTKTMEAGGRSGFSAGDLLVFATNTNPANCAMVQISALPLPPSERDVKHESGEFNDPSGVVLTGASQGFVFNLGNAVGGTEPRLNVWSIANGRLTIAEQLGVAAQASGEVAEGIVDLQAEYIEGRDNNADNVLDAIQTTTAVASLRNVVAVRVALLARSGQFDKDFCAANPRWGSGVAASPNDGSTTSQVSFAMRNIDGTDGSAAPCSTATPDPNHWGHYRYRVYETVIPLRNMIWGTAP